jgi:hypothetical protein
MALLLSVGSLDPELSGSAAFDFEVLWFTRLSASQ